MSHFLRPLSLRALAPILAERLSELAGLQITDSADPDYGALINPGYGIADNKMTTEFIVLGGYQQLIDAANHQISQSTLEAAADSLLAAQRPSGNIDLLSVNYDSAPDTGFSVQQICTLFALSDSQWRAQRSGLMEKLEHFVRRAVPGICGGGFHTPNHRWVIASALLQAQAIFPDLEVVESVEAYLQEGFDIDEEGAFIERSVGVYDAVNDRSLLFIYELGDRADALEAVVRNLDFCLHLLHADGSAETGLSRRQDYGLRSVAAGLIQPLLGANAHHSNPDFARAATYLWGRNKANDHLLWTIYALLRYGEVESDAAALPGSYRRHFPRNDLWRLRRGNLSVSVFGASTRLLSLVFGQAELASLKIALTYFGGACGRFWAETMEATESGVRLRSSGRRRPRRPGYELPLGRPVPPQEWTHAITEREIYPLPPAELLLAIEEIDGGVALHLTSAGVLDGVALELSFDFPPGGVWETSSVRTLPVAGQPIFVKKGYGIMRYGNDGIALGPGAGEHSMWPMREAEPAPGHVRVLFSLRTPVDHRFTIGGVQGQRMPEIA